MYSEMQKLAQNFRFVMFDVHVFNEPQTDWAEILCSCSRNLVLSYLCWIFIGIEEWNDEQDPKSEKLQKIVISPMFEWTVVTVPQGYRKTDSAGL